MIQKKYRLLVVDDNKVALDAINYIVEANELPFLVSLASSVQEALAFISKEAYDCIITDIRMPKVSGLELIEQVSGDDGQPIIIICSAYKDFEVAQTAIKYGIKNYLLKPLVVDDFLTTMKNVAQLLYLKHSKKDKDLEYDLNKALSTKQPNVSPKTTELFETCERLVLVKSSKGEEINCADLIKDKISELFAGVLHPIEHDISTHILFVNQKSDDLSFDGVLSRLNSIYSDYKNNVMFCTGNQCNTPQELIKSLSTLKQFSEKVDFNTESIYNYIDCQRKVPEGQLKTINDRIEHCIKNGSSEEILTSVRDYVKLSMIDSDTTIAHIKFFLIKIVNLINTSLTINTDSVAESTTSLIVSAETLSQTMVCFSEYLKKSYSTATGDSINIIESIEKIVDEEYNNYKLSLEYIADRVYLTASYLSRLYLRKTGVNLFVHITEKRISKSKELLLGTNMKVGDIAKSVGYEDTAYFSRIFKQNCNVTPREFRRLNGKGSD